MTSIFMGPVRGSVLRVTSRDDSPNVLESSMLLVDFKERLRDTSISLVDFKEHRYSACVVS